MLSCPNQRLIGFQKSRKWMGKNKKYLMIAHGKFQIEWATRLLWVEGFVSDGLFIRDVGCKVCSLIENNENIIGCKWDTLAKH